MRLSPLDPLHYAMLGTRALTHMMLGEYAVAAQWAERAARSPGAHVLIAMIAAAAHALAGDSARAASWAANVRERNPRSRVMTSSALSRCSPRRRRRELRRRSLVTGFNRARPLASPDCEFPRQFIH